VFFVIFLIGAAYQVMKIRAARRLAAPAQPAVA
jgi:hypothetical protein